MTAPNPQKSKSTIRLSIILFAIVVGGLVVGLRYQQLHTQMMELNRGLAPIKEVPKFTMQNQDGEKVNPGNFIGNVWLANFVFTRCPGPCLQLTKQFAELQKDLPKEVKLASFSVDPDFDTPAVLKKYGIANGADFSRWSFLTSDREQMIHVANKGFLVTMVEQKDPELIAKEGPVTHGNWIVLVDQKGRIRKFYDGLNPTAVGELKKAVKYLLDAGPEGSEPKGPPIVEPPKTL